MRLKPDMLKDVPHGEVRMEYYHSSVTGREKCAWVYTPAGYDDNDKKYPVLYIQHGVHIRYHLQMIVGQP